MLFLGIKAHLVKSDDPIASVKGGGGELVHEVGGQGTGPADHQHQSRARVIGQGPEILTRGRGQSVGGEGVLLRTKDVNTFIKVTCLMFEGH